MPYVGTPWVGSLMNHQVMLRKPRNYNAAVLWVLVAFLHKTSFVIKIYCIRKKVYDLILSKLVDNVIFSFLFKLCNSVLLAAFVSTLRKCFLLIVMPNFLAMAWTLDVCRSVFLFSQGSGFVL